MVLADNDVAHVCSGSGDTIRLPKQAFEIPSQLQPLLDQLSSERRSELRKNALSLTPEQLTASIRHLDTVDVDNSISTSLRAHATDGKIQVAELNAERGRYWCELAVQVLSTPALRNVDVWLLNEFDLGMARSNQEHTIRLFAHALGLNYAWAAEFVELTNGNREEQARTAGQENRWSLHGNAILSRWPIRDAKVVRMPNMAPLFYSRGFETAFGYEKRLGGRMTLFATTGKEGTQMVVGATHADFVVEQAVAHIDSHQADAGLH